MVEHAGNKRPTAMKTPNEDRFIKWLLCGLIFSMAVESIFLVKTHGTGNAGKKLKACPEHLGKLDAGKLKFSTAQPRRASNG